MSWATAAIERLRGGEAVEIRPRGNSMVPTIYSGQLCRVEPIGDVPIRPGDIVLTRVGGRDYLHIVKSIADDRFLICNRRGRENGWTHRVFGRLTKVYP